MTRIWTRRLALALQVSFCTAATLAAGPSLAQATWPSQPIRMVVSSASGSQVDTVARIISQELAQALKQPIVVENRPGANGQLAISNVLASPPDGHTILFTSASSTVMNQATRPNLPYDITKDVTAVTQIGGGGGVFLVVARDFPATNLKEFVAMLQAHPGRYNYASWGVGSTGHLSMGQLTMLTGIAPTHVPYKGVPQIFTDLQGGILNIAFTDVTTAVPHLQSGAVRALGITGTRRAPLFPDVPTMAEQGFPLNTDGWLGVFVAKRTPPAVVAQLNEEITKAQRLPEVMARIRPLNLSPATGMSSDAFSQKVRHDYAVWSEVVKANNIKPD